MARRFKDGFGNDVTKEWYAKDEKLKMLEAENQKLKAALQSSLIVNSDENKHVSSDAVVAVSKKPVNVKKFK